MKYIFLIVGLCFTLAGSAVAPVKARVVGLEKDSVYMNLLQEEAVFKSRLDSIIQIIAVKREGFVTDTLNRSKIGTDILRLEGRLFDIKNNLGIVASQANAIEQEFLINNLTKEIVLQEIKPQSSASNYKNLISNNVFKENLSEAEYKTLINDAKSAIEITELIKRYADNYREFKRLSELYEVTPSPVTADSIYNETRSHASRGKSLEGVLKEKWDKIYSDKIYLYSLMLDKMNKGDELYKLNEKSREIITPDSVVSAAIADYPAQAALVIDYELAIANIAGITASVDSLKAAQRDVNNMNLAFKTIAVTERDFVNYSDITFPESAHKRIADVPAIEIPGYGKYYSITLGTFYSTPLITIFKGATPLYKEKINDGRTRFFTGMFRTMGAAIEAADKLKDDGIFKRPEVVEWQNGVYENLTPKLEKNSGTFRVEIDSELDDEGRYIISKFAANKEISRTEEVYLVGMFSNKLHAEELAAALTKGGIKATVKDIP